MQCQSKGRFININKSLQIRARFARQGIHINRIDAENIRQSP
jgi:hypothetical protein